MGNEVIKETSMFVHIGTPLYSKSSLENEIIESKIGGAYKKVWKLLSIGSKNAQLNPLTFSKGYWSAVVTKLCYGLFMVPLNDRNKEELDKGHISIAKKIQGLQPNTPAMVPLKWTRFTTYRDKEAMNLFWQLMSLPMECVYKQILVSRIIDIETSLNSHISKGPVEIMLSKIKDYGLGHEVSNALNTGIIMKIDQWKQKVTEKVIEKEYHEWIATSMMYRSVKEFKSL